MADLFASISDWLMEQTLLDDPIEVTLAEFGQRLLDGGVPIARISIGRSILHPVIGLIDMQWERDTGNVTTQQVPRHAIDSVLSVDNPFAALANNEVDIVQADLTNPDDVARYEVFRELAAKGLTGYVAFGRHFGMSQSIYKKFATDFRGASLSFATSRFSGFSQSDLKGLERLVTPLCACVRVANDNLIATTILETYLGRISGQQVLRGNIERGDGQQIDCAILYSDLRGSLELSRDMDTQTYLDTLNAYFDCTANAVTEHGGEVLKFIGDGVLAIFPFEDTTRPRANMCAAALSSAREAFARATYTNRGRTEAGLPAIEFGIALHLGSVIYGNVGTAKRLDFTATGPAVGLAARVEALTKTLGHPLLATNTFAEHAAEQGVPVPPQSVKGLEQEVQLVSCPVA